MRITVNLVLISIVLLAALATLPSISDAANIVVNPDGSGDYTTIQAAVNAASPGDTITVMQATYTENVNVNKKLTLIGINYPVVDGKNGLHCFYITANGVNISSFMVTNSQNTGIHLLSVSNCNIINNIVYNNTNSSDSTGIFLINSNYNNLTGNTANSNSYGIELYNSDYNNLAGNTANSNSYGIGLYGSDYNNLAGNTADNNNYLGIRITSTYTLVFSTNNILTGNTANNNEEGIDISFSTNNILIGNTANGNSFYGLTFYNSWGNILRNNEMSGNKYNFQSDDYNSFMPYNNIDTSNLVNGKPIYYLVNVSNRVIDSSSNAGTVYIIGCNNITIRDLTLDTNYYGAYYLDSNNSHIENVSAYENYVGISLIGSNNNNISRSTFNNNYAYGINVEIYSNNNNIAGNTVNNNRYGIELYLSNYNNVTGNTANNSYRGMDISWYATGNTVMWNIFNNNRLGMIIEDDSCTDNEICLNVASGNLINAVDASPGNNYWNSTAQLDYRYGGSLFTNYLGNYWGDYNGTDTNHDGIGDIPYPINSTQDYRPLMGTPYIDSDGRIVISGGVTPLNVTVVLPVNGTVNVPISSVVKATFNKALNASSINGSTFLLQIGGQPVSGTVTYYPGNLTAVFKPSALLSNGVPYNATITTGVMDLNGTRMAANYTWSFRTVNATVPTVISTSPLNNATSVPVSAIINATFSQGMNASSINSSTFLVKNGNSPVFGSVVYYSGNKTAVFRPTSPLSYGTLYNVTITTGVKDLNGTRLASNYTWKFTTVTVSPPVVVSTIPTNSATGIAISSSIKATFNKDMNPSTITTSTFLVKYGTTPVSGKVTYYPGNHTAVFKPSASFSYGTKYTATITTGAKDTAGNPLSSNYNWQFTTISISPPVVVSTVPLNGATGITITSPIKVTFSKDMNPSTITTSTFLVKYGTTLVPGKVTYYSNNHTAVFKPSASLKNGASYAVTITTGVKDTTGRSLASNYNWKFTTIKNPGVVSTSPVNGATLISTSSVIKATFSQDMNPSTITASTFLVKYGTTPVSGKVTYYPGNHTAVFKPSASLKNGVKYTVTITTGAKDVSGSPLSSNYNWQFTTITCPRVLYIIPANGTTGVLSSSVIKAEFDRDMNPSSINSSTFIVKAGNTIVPGKITYYPSCTVIFTPSNRLRLNTKYTVTITTGVKEPAGNHMASNYISQFTTGNK